MATQPPLPPPPPARIRSDFSVESWTCHMCQHLNLPFKMKFFKFSRSVCEICKVETFPSSFSFQFGSLSINHRQIIPTVRDQDDEDLCVIYSSLAAMEISMRREGALRCKAFTGTLSKDDVVQKYLSKTGFPYNEEPPFLKDDHRTTIIHNILKEEGVKDERGNTYHIQGVESHNIKKMTFESVCKLLADGKPLLAVINAKHRTTIINNKKVITSRGTGPRDIYDDAAVVTPDGIREQLGQHMIVLIGGMRENRHDILSFLDSFGPQKHSNEIGLVFYEECLRQLWEIKI